MEKFMESAMRLLRRRRRLDGTEDGAVIDDVRVSIGAPFVKNATRGPVPIFAWCFQSILFSFMFTLLLLVSYTNFFSYLHFDATIMYSDDQIVILQRKGKGVADFYAKRFRI